MKITETHLDILECGASSTPVRWEHKWIINGEPVTRQVNALKRHGLLECVTYAGGTAYTHKTDKGQDILSAHGRGAHGRAKARIGGAS